VAAICGLVKNVFGAGTAPRGHQIAAEVGHSMRKNSFAARIEAAMRGSTGKPLSA
jgi:hypothetical protein